MADSAEPVAVAREDGVLFKLHDKHLDKDAPIPPAAEIDLDELDLTDVELWRRDAMWDRFERMRAEAPLHYCKDSPFGPYWSLTRYDDILAVDTNHEDFSSEPSIVLPDPEEDLPLKLFISMDPPKHDVQRKTVQPVVGPANLKSLEALIRERTQQVLDSLPRDEPFDWVDTVSIELTTMMLATLFDFPFEDRRKLTRWSDVATAGKNRSILPGGEEQRRAELLECLQYFTGLWNQRAAAEPRNDMISMLAHGEETKNMPPMEYLGNLVLLIVGGNDTTRNSMTGGLYAFSKWPGELAKMRANPELIPSAVSEIIRWQTPLAYMRRKANRDVEMHGKTIKAGDKVCMWYVSGNRDERHFSERANEIWIDRPRVRSHMAFGYGIHRCVGNRLAELQLRILWEEILARFDEIEVLEEPRRTPSSFVKGYWRMPVRIPG
jgi:cytochrome P450